MTSSYYRLILDKRQSDPPCSMISFSLRSRRSIIHEKEYYALTVDAIAHTFMSWPPLVNKTHIPSHASTVPVYDFDTQHHCRGLVSQFGGMTSFWDRKRKDRDYQSICIVSRYSSKVETAHALHGIGSLFCSTAHVVGCR